MSDTSKLTLLGSDTKYQYDNPSADILEVFDNQHPETRHVVGLECTEFTALCPMTGQPDFGQIHIVYVPDKLCVESKSLKLYLGAYRNHGSFHEDCVNTIANDIAEKIHPLYIRVFGDFNVRGGIAIKPLAVKQAPDIEPVLLNECLAVLEQYDRVMNR